jgi:enoyl-CoA hydratase/carnithine racemase
MSYSSIGYRFEQSIAYLQLMRPASGNVISTELADEFRSACTRIGENPDTRLVIVTGSGDSAFCLGNELERASRDAGAVAPSSRHDYGIASSLASLSCPVIAVINGDAIGAGLELALACDLRIAVDTAHFGLPYIACGLIPMDGGTQRLPRIVGKSHGLRLIITGETIDAIEAHRIGLVNRIVTRAALSDVTAQFSTLARQSAPIAVQYAKEAIGKGLDMTLEQGLQLEANLYFLLHTTKDRTEGIQAFRDKRPAQFGGG